MRIKIVLIVISLACLIARPVFAQEAQPLASKLIELIDKKMDDFHAAQGDKRRYLNHFSQDSVFMGTDDWERWPYEVFAKYVNKHFKGGKGWSYTPVTRYTNLNSQKTFAWVDEIVESEKWGRFRGTAVLENTQQGWKLKHYSLTKLVPTSRGSKSVALPKMPSKQEP